MFLKSIFILMFVIPFQMVAQTVRLDMDYDIKGDQSSIEIRGQDTIKIGVLLKEVNNLLGYQVKLSFDKNKINYLSTSFENSVLNPGKGIFIPLPVDETDSTLRIQVANTTASDSVANALMGLITLISNLNPGDTTHLEFIKAELAFENADIIPVKNLNPGMIIRTPIYEIEMSQLGKGWVEPESIQTVLGDSVFSISAQPDTGFLFSHWDVSGNIQLNDSMNSQTEVFHIKSSATLSAIFIPKEFKLRVNPGVGGRVNISKDTTVSFKDTISIISSPDLGMQTKNWSYTEKAYVVIDSSLDNIVLEVLDSGNIDVNFQKIVYPVSLRDSLITDSLNGTNPIILLTWGSRKYSKYLALKYHENNQWVLINENLTDSSYAWEIDDGLAGKIQIGLFVKELIIGLTDTINLGSEPIVWVPDIQLSGIQNRVYKNSWEFLISSPVELDEVFGLLNNDIDKESIDFKLVSNSKWLYRTHILGHYDQIDLSINVLYKDETIKIDSLFNQAGGQP